MIEIGKLRMKGCSFGKIMHWTWKLPYFGEHMLEMQIIYRDRRPIHLAIYRRNISDWILDLLEMIGKIPVMTRKISLTKFI